MSSTSFQSEEFPRSHERRRFPRVRPPSLAYVDVDSDNGGILLNLSENGVALQAVSPLVDLTRVSLRIQPPKPRMRISVSAEITWLSESKKEAGLQFFELSDDTRLEIANWISAEVGAREPRLNDDSASPQIAQVSSTPYAEDTPPRRRKWSFLLENSSAGDAPADQKAPNSVLNPSMLCRNPELHTHATVSDKSPGIPTFDPDPDNERIHARTSGADEQPNSPSILSGHIPRSTQSQSLQVPPPPAAASTVQPPPSVQPSSPLAAERIAKHYAIPDAHIPARSKDSPHLGERRRFTRQRLSSLAYLDIGPDNGGMVLNLSETGLALQTFNPLIGQTRVGLRIQPPKSRERIQATAEITWLSESKREAGLRFIELAEDARVEIAEWVSAEAGASEPPPQDDSASRQTPQVSPAEVSQAPAPEKRHRNWKEWVPLFGDSNLTESPADQNVPNDLLNISTGCESFELPCGSAVSETFSDDPTNIPVSFEQAIDQRANNVNRLAVSSSAISVPVPDVRHAPLKLPLLLIAACWQFLSERFPKWVRIAALCACVALVSLFLGMTISRRLLRDRSGGSSAAKDTRDAGPPPVSSTALDAPSGRTASPSEAAGSKMRRANGERVLLAPQIVIPRKYEGENPQPGPPEGGPDSPVANLSLPIEPPPQTAKSDAENASVPSSPVLSVAPSGAHDVAVAQPEKNPSPPASAERRTDCYLLYRVEPLYPREAKEKHIEGTVALHLLIGSDGRVRSVRELSGPGALVPAALSAAREWRFIPALRNGQPIDTEKDVSIEFHLPN